MLAAAGYGAWYVSTPLAVAKLPLEVEIPRGASFRGVMDQLASAPAPILAGLFA